MVKEVNELRRRIAEALNESRLPPVVAQLVLETMLPELRQLVAMQAAAEAAEAPQKTEERQEE